MENNIHPFILPIIMKLVLKKHIVSSRDVIWNTKNYLLCTPGSIFIGNTVREETNKKNDESFN